jgi:hypothetical protein
MKAIAACGSGPSCDSASCWPRLLFLPLVCLAATGALGQDIVLPGVDSAVVTGEPARSRLELSTSSLPLFESPDGASRASRVEMVWLPPRHPTLGLALGLTSTDGQGLKAPGNTSAPALDLGLHWRLSRDSQYRVDVTAWRRMTPYDAFTLAQHRQPEYGARFEMQVGAMPASGFVAERGFLGLQLESGARISVRKSHGKPMFYYRTRF